MAYTCTVTLDFPRPAKLFRSISIVTGKADLSAYHATMVEVTDITDIFEDTPRVIADGVSENGYLVKWDVTSLAFKAYVPVKVITGDVVADANNTLVKSAAATLEVAGTGTAFEVPLTEAANDADVGEIYFIAIGLA